MGRPGSLTRTRPDVTLRVAREDDAALIRDLRNEADAVRFSATGRAVSGPEHARWFAAALADSRTLLWVAEEKGITVGQVRVDIEGDAGVFSIAIAASARRRGVGQEMLRLAIEEIEQRGVISTMTAVTRPDNLVSIRAFEKVGFTRRDATRDGFVVLELRLDS